MNEKTQLHLTCLHEAGHLMGYIAAGWGPNVVEIRVNARANSGVTEQDQPVDWINGSIRAKEIPPEFEMSEPDLENLAVTYMAGSAASCRGSFEQPPTPEELQHMIFGDLQANQYCGDLQGVNNILHILKAARCLTEEEADMVFWDWCGKASELVLWPQHWEFIQKVAGKLLLHGSLQDMCLVALVDSLNSK